MEIKVQRENGEKVQKEYGKSRFDEEKKKQFQRPRCKIAVTNLELFFSNNLDPCLQNFTTEVTLPEHQLGLLSAAPGQYKAREGQDWVVKYLQLVHDT